MLFRPSATAVIRKLGQGVSIFRYVVIRYIRNGDLSCYDIIQLHGEITEPG